MEFQEIFKDIKLVVFTSVNCVVFKNFE